MRSVVSKFSVRMFAPALLLLILGLAAQGCVLAVVPLIFAVMGDTATATVEIPRPAQEVYDTGLTLAKDDKTLTVDKSDPSTLTIAVSRGEQTGVFKAVPIDNRTSQLIITVKSGVSLEEDKRLALRGATRVCEVLGVKFTLIE